MQGQLQSSKQHRHELVFPRGTRLPCLWPRDPGPAPPATPRLPPEGRRSVLRHKRKVPSPRLREALGQEDPNNQLQKALLPPGFLQRPAQSVPWKKPASCGTTTHWGTQRTNTNDDRFTLRGRACLCTSVGLNPKKNDGCPLHFMLLSNPSTHPRPQPWSPRRPPTRPARDMDAAAEGTAV